MNQYTIVETVTRGLWASSIKCYNVQRWVVLTAAGVTDAQAVADFTSQMNTLMGQQDDIATGIISWSSHVFNEVYPNKRFISFLPNTHTVGLAAGSPAPIGAVFRGCQVTAVGKIRGQKYFSGIPLSFITNGVLTAAAQTQLTEVMIYYCGAFAVSGRTYGPVIKSTLNSSYQAILGYYIDTNVCYFTRRRPRT